MCGRYCLKVPNWAYRKALEIWKATGDRSALDDVLIGIPPRWNVAPSQEWPTILPNEDGDIVASLMRWGLVPYWTKPDEKPKLAPINARAEEAFAKPMFRQSIQRRRCAIPADGFFEWRRLDERTKLPFHIQRRGGEPLFFAGIYERATETRPATFALFTTGPNELMAPIHDRMPVILSDEAAREWATPGALSADRFAELCRPFPAEAMEAWPVSVLVNSARNDLPECVARVGDN